MGSVFECEIDTWKELWKVTNSTELYLFSTLQDAYKLFEEMPESPVLHNSISGANGSPHHISAPASHGYDECLPGIHMGIGDKKNTEHVDKNLMPRRT